MKPLKYTVAALAILAAASFTQSAHATTAAGNLVFGVDDTSQTVLNSYELNLGAFSSLSNGETWNLGTSVSTFFSNSTSLEFNIAGAGGTNGTGAGGLAKQEVAFTAQTGQTPSPTSSTFNTASVTEDGAFNGTAITLPSNTSSNGTAISAVTVANSTPGSFSYEFDTNNSSNTNGGEYGFTDGNGQLGDTFPTGDVLTLYTVTNGAASAVADGTFSLSNVGGNEILEFNTLAATPEPSAYALGLCAVALFWVLKRRRSVA
jgi:hypothetical protein